MEMKNFDAEYQIQGLGLARALRKFASLKILDIGCGRKMTLVASLNELGHMAEGIDPELEQESAGLTRQRVTALWPEKGCLPRPNETYDLVVSYQNPVLNMSLSCLRNTNYLYDVLGGEFEHMIRKTDREAFPIVREAMRAVKKTGAFAIYPALDIIEDMMADHVKNESWKVSHINVPNVSEPVFVENGDTGEIEDCSSSLKRRTVIYRESINPKLRNALLGYERK